MPHPTIASIRKAVTHHPDNAQMRAKGYKPLFAAHAQSRIVLIGQAPGIRAQEADRPWHDHSGQQLRAWLGISDEDFYDATKVALIPMDFYFPGKGKTGDLPPRKGFAALWHPQLFAVMPQVQLIVLIGQYAQQYYLHEKKQTLTERVKQYHTYLPQNFFPIPHPSPRNNIWKKKHPWFEEEVVPVLQQTVKKILKG